MARKSNKRGVNARNKTNLTYRGVTYKSQFEVDVAKELYRLSRKKGGFPFEFGYELDEIPYVLENNYNPDFKIVKEDGSVLYIEVKGFFDRDDRRKMLAVKAQYPDTRICILFLRDNKLDKRSKTTYSQWAEKNGFEYAVGELPEEWVS